MKYSIDTAKLAEMYLSGMTGREIGQETGISPRTVIRYLKASGVAMRNPGNPAIPALADREWLEAEYNGKRKSSTQIAAELGCHTRSVIHALHRAGMTVRPSGSEKGHKRATDEARAKMSAAKRDIFIGSANPNWKGGIPWKDPERGRMPYKIWAKAVKDRDGWQCVECGSTESPHAHHIKHWRHYPNLRYDLDNGITLCRYCHEAAHGRGFKFRWPQARKNPHERAAPVKG